MKHNKINQWLVIITILLVITVICLIGYILYDKKDDNKTLKEENKVVEKPVKKTDEEIIIEKLEYLLHVKYDEDKSSTSFLNLYRDVRNLTDDDKLIITLESVNYKSLKPDYSQMDIPPEFEICTTGLSECYFFEQVQRREIIKMHKYLFNEQPYIKTVVRGGISNNNLYVFDETADCYYKNAGEVSATANRAITYINKIDFNNDIAKVYISYGYLEYRENEGYLVYPSFEATEDLATTSDGNFRINEENYYMFDGLVITFNKNSKGEYYFADAA